MQFGRKMSTGQNYGKHKIILVWSKKNGKHRIRLQFRVLRNQGDLTSDNASASDTSSERDILCHMSTCVYRLPRRRHAQDNEPQESLGASRVNVLLKSAIM
jgi:hypothetical protein